jgi:uncharacterized protein (DUF58 family)
MRLTRAGIGVALAAVICFVLGRLFGTSELHVLAAMCGIALLAAVLYTALAGLDLSVGRVATPSSLRAGTPARIDLSLCNKGQRATPVLRADDQLNGQRGASLLLASIRKAETARIAYRLPTRRRGELTVGPLDISVGDPLGLTSGTARASDQIRLVVHPRLMDLGVLHATAGHDPTADLQPVRALATGGDEFFALRPYVVGDELKRVHWKSTARTGELVVRQEERPRTGRVTVVLDRRRESYDDDGFDRACSAAISTLYAAWRGDDALRFLTTTPNSVSDIRSRRELDAVDEQLALIETSGDALLARTIDEISRVGRGGTMVLITGLASDELATSIERARRTYGSVLPIVCQIGVDEPPPWALLHDGNANFPELWRAAVAGSAKR